MKLSVSPDNTSLAAIYNNGKISLYSIPNLKELNSWNLSEQVCQFKLLFKITN
jgi:hypothetical protein